MKNYVCSFFLLLFLSAILLSGCTGCQSQELTNEQIQAQARLDPAKLLENDIFSVSPQELEKMEGVTEKNSIFSTDVTLYGHPVQVIYFFNCIRKFVCGITYFLQIPDQDAPDIIENIRTDFKIRFGGNYEETRSIDDTGLEVRDHFRQEGNMIPISELWQSLSDRENKIIRYQLIWKQSEYEPMFWVMSSKRGIDIQIAFNK